MKRLLILLAVLVASIWAGIKIHHDPGYILIAYQSWTVEMPFWVGLLLIAIGFYSVYILLRLLSITGSMGSRFHAWRLRRRAHRAHNRTYQGIIELAEGRYASAEHYLLQAATSSETPFINYLAAAYAAHQRHAYAQRDEYIHFATLSAPEAEIAAGIVQAQLQLSQQQWQEALATLRQLHAQAATHPQILRLLNEVYLQLNDWQALTELLPLLRKNRAANSLERDALEYKIFKAAVKHQTVDAESLRNHWHHLRSKYQNDIAFLKAYIPALLAYKDYNEAEQVIREAITKEWDDDLIRWYGLTEGDNPLKQLNLVEDCLKHRSEDAALLQTAGRLALRNQLWGKARSYLEYSLRLAPSADTYLLLGNLLQQLGEKDASYAIYQQGLQLAVNDESLIKD